MRPIHTLALLALGGLAACAPAVLETPDPGSCGESTAQNTWPQFEGTGGELPVFTDSQLGWFEGRVPPDFSLTDQYGNDVCLWQMVASTS